VPIRLQHSHVGDLGPGVVITLRAQSGLVCQKRFGEQRPASAVFGAIAILGGRDHLWHAVLTVRYGERPSEQLGDRTVVPAELPAHRDRGGAVDLDPVGFSVGLDCGVGLPAVGDLEDLFAI